MANMTRKKAIKLLIGIAKEKRRREYAFDANLYDKGMHTARTELAKEKYQEITQAIEILEQEA
jgi:hypothetical protein